MNKIPTLYVRDFTQDRGRYVTDEITPGCEWVLAGEGVPTRKHDGTCVALLGGVWWARREVKPGKTPPDGFLPVGHDETTGKTVGWEPIGQSSFVAFFAEALAQPMVPCEGTYELVGPKFNGNPERLTRHELKRHAEAESPAHPECAPKDLVRAVAVDGWEGIVWHHPDGRMAKLKARDLRPLVLAVSA